VLSFRIDRDAASARRLCRFRKGDRQHAVDEEGAKATFRDGVLTVTLPKSAEAARGRRIPINAETQH